MTNNSWAKGPRPEYVNLLFKEESYEIRGAVFEVYTVMGCGFMEAVYQDCLEKEFTRRKIPFRTKPQLSVFYKGEILQQAYIPDFICFDKIIVELKAIKEINDEHRAQLINYLKASNIKVGLLINFNHYPKADIERIVV